MYPVCTTRLPNNGLKLPARRRTRIRRAAVSGALRLRYRKPIPERIESKAAERYWRKSFVISRATGRPAYFSRRVNEADIWLLTLHAQR